ncbi:glutaminyl-tRNA synthase (glutamine-hydrolyzing) subunit A [Candidatus Roizmanbacteria bacterium RIFCSPLOWO2_12_FULL_40_12]|uniref:Glutamyl-tRNA(Gln) amidotransferase subunit A n=1 Tax=Candidatus Roizmanbacteria bacterium RIFCSPLOWO2_01_FULL_40_42 TaxID=1802066 RepID=A0A1F7J6P6_9BACT|nr:MAG: glutaminyl-tRNA synthase (glutamine-hydrolyzing) subunit A [Candidatus Roizmanbacteria bacterium RIFCSPHIGHO2_01_FULL_40_98]OGK29181.1 MAG: glutaminyl-tRNA synthase (glutamine-hydrolyzing) subunit A [Candidatus Roizmanbacteria bacterium RIFCSPHIGHO2_02_FULL_40_53]OGK30884.1 MAG: glutaminyl-tRNA synthase (glutamine-hydrolyzing) subunit A [Candidatus Roizmanbacteria bacterium RIFCSPHIGHO2_12_41_18]OGK37218.1 MAG: glutaminyl-tRNA synthase (glutamine-hydrolyzing) subunit A [Candidatus Roizma
MLGKSYVELLGLLNSKKISTKELHEYFSKREKKYNKELNVFLTLAENPGVEGEMPLAYKDNYNTEGIRTTASSKVLDSYISPYDATVVERLKKSKTYVFGKTNLDAWAHGASTETSDYGATKNPWDTSRVPGGSSGGSAAATASYLMPATIGSDTGGSIRCPASWCGVVGLKPTYGRVSRYGVIAMGSSFDCPGPLSWHVEDCALLLSHMAGFDPYDATTSSKPVPAYMEKLNAEKKLKIGIAESFFENVDKEVKKKIEEALEILRKMGHIEKKIKMLNPKHALSAYTILQRSEVSSNLGRYDGIRYGNDRSFFKEEAKKRIMLGTYTLSHGYYDQYYKKAQKVRALIIEDFKKAFDDVDIIIAPSTPSTAVKLGEFKKYPFFGEQMDILNEPANVSGIPSINIPVGLDSKRLPVGMQIMGRQFDEETILNVSYKFQRETNFFNMRETLLKKYHD